MRVLNQIFQFIRKPLVVCSIAFAGVTGQVQAAPEEITYMLPAPAVLPAFAPWMIAQQKGYYADENIKVNFIAGKGGVDVAKQVGAGNVPIGGAIGDTPIIVRPNGVPIKVVAVLGGGSLMHLAVNEGAGINALKDLKGKTITVISYSDTTYYALLGMLRKNGLSKNDVDIQAAGPAGVWQLFASNKATAMASVPDWTATVLDSGMKVKIIPADEYFKSMAQSIVASDEMIQNRPELIKKLVRATLRGMEDIMKDPKVATRDYIAAVPSYKGREAYIEEVLKLYNRYVYPGQKVLGQIDGDRMESLQKFYLSEGVIQKETPTKELYTNQFIGTAR